MQLEGKIWGITSTDQKRLTEEFSIRMIEFEARRETLGIQALQKTIEQCEIHSGYPKMHFVSHISKSIYQMGSGDDFTTDMSERLHIANVNAADQSSNTVNYIRQILKPNDRCTGLDYMEATLSYLALEGW